MIFSVGSRPSGVTNNLPSGSKVAQAKMTCCALLADFERRRLARIAKASKMAQAPMDYQKVRNAMGVVGWYGPHTNAMTIMTV